jgi:endonuclease YncB( thermonuclease family)
VDTQPHIPRTRASARCMPTQPGQGATGETNTSQKISGRYNWLRGTTYYASAARAIDGDTIIVLWDVHQYTRPSVNRIRLAGLDAPELHPRAQPGAAAAYHALKTLVADVNLLVVPTRTWPDKYGRMVARVYTRDNDDLTHAMIRAGVAIPWSWSRRARARRAQNQKPQLSAPQPQPPQPPDNSGR